MQVVLVTPESIVLSLRSAQLLRVTPVDPGIIFCTAAASESLTYLEILLAICEKPTVTNSIHEKASLIKFPCMYGQGGEKGCMKFLLDSTRHGVSAMN